MALACGAPPPSSSSGTTTTSEATPSGGPTPWDGAAATGSTVSGSFTAHMGEPLPGGGWFTETTAEGTELHTGQAYSQAVITAVADATHDVVVVRIHGVPTEAGDWSVVELDVAVNHWVAGDIPLDGTSAIGQLTRPDGSQAYLHTGTLTVTHPGLDAGAEVRGHFNGIPTWEAAR